MKKDYYEILGITEEEKKLQGDEFKKIVKKKYRELAVKYHPDKFNGKSDQEKKDAENKFKDIAESYEILSDDNKRKQYDFGGDDFNVFGEGGFNPFDVFKRMREDFEGFSSRRQTIVQGDDVNINVYLTLKEAYNGVSSKIIEYDRTIPCDKCNGTGSKDGKKKQCSHCGGKGYTENIKITPFGQMIQRSTCKYCNGTGTEICEKCHNCGGSGVIKEKTKKEINIPKGIFDGAVIRIDGEGNVPPSSNGVNAYPGNLIIMFIIKPDNIFTVSNTIHLKRTVYLSIPEALIGGHKEIECIDGSVVNVVIEKLTPNGKTLRVRGKGMPNISNPTQYGDMIFEIQYKMPKSITEEQEKLLNKFQEIENKK